MRKIAFQTLGCRLNQYETDSIVTNFKEAGYEVVSFEEKADAYIINTCTVTNKSDRKSRNIINRAKNNGPDPVVVVTGCYVDSDKDALEGAKGITYIVDNDRKSEVFNLVDAHFKGEVLDPSSIQGDRFDFNLAQDGFHTRGMVKIQDGCDNFCTFCIIPSVRGAARSRKVKDVLQNVRDLVHQGFKEVVITGVNISRYESEGVTFEDLLEKILNIDLDFRLRISSMEPEMIGDKFFTLLDHPKMTPHLHLCLQSGSEKILRKMRRQYTYAGYAELVDKIRNYKSDFNITTDVIIGFPGETEEEFKETLEAVTEMNFGHVHSFPYSRRKGTRADRMEGQIPDPVKKERGEALRKLADQVKTEYRQSFIGKTETVLVETVKDGIGRGYGQHYIPFEFSYTSEPNEWVKVKALSLLEGDEMALKGVVES